jgi:hypothetical protein
MQLAHPTRFERVTFASGRGGRSNQADPTRDRQAHREPGRYPQGRLFQLSAALGLDYGRRAARVQLTFPRRPAGWSPRKLVPDQLVRTMCLSCTETAIPPAASIAERRSLIVSELACVHPSIFEHAEIGRRTKQSVRCVGAEAPFNVLSVGAAHPPGELDCGPLFKPLTPEVAGSSRFFARPFGS